MSIKLRLILDVEYDANGTPVQSLKEILGDVVVGAANRGFLTEEGAEVEDYSYRVEEVE